MMRRGGVNLFGNGFGNGFGLTEFPRGRTTLPRDIVFGGAALPFISDPRSDVPDRSCLPCPATRRRPA
jgi:hypothetical protein